ncbi:hypothetical protein LCGC14_0670320 [marine sediment metagenome]|uniref:Membrane fusion protein biotin-lipoyl like domain-containing protein n=1 Tax=marine sediment metagenome TaxID=412755 RepID=A0A0F9QW70_9ZZZZ
MRRIFRNQNTMRDTTKRLPDSQSGVVSGRFLLLTVVPLIIILIAAVVYLLGGRYVETENAYVRADVVSVVPEVSGTVVNVAVKENQKVKAGDPLFEIDPERYRIALDTARSERAEVKTQIETMKASYREKQQELSAAKSNQAFAEREYERQGELAKKRAVSDSILDSYRHKMELAEEQVQQVRTGLERIKAGLGGDPDIAVEKHPLYRKAQSALDAAQMNREDTRVAARFDGIASQIPVEGQYASPSRAAMSLVSVKNVWVDANLKETQLTHIQPGQNVEIKVDAYPDDVWEGHVGSIAGAAGSEFSILPAQNATGNWVKVVQRIPVRIELENTIDGPSLLSGMSVAVSIDIGHQNRGPAFIQPLTSWLQGVFFTTSEPAGDSE